MNVLVDTNIILDILTEDARWFEWSSTTLANCSEKGTLWINPIIYTEVSIGFSRIEDLDKAIPPSIFRRSNLPWEAGFLAGKIFFQYKKAKGLKVTPIPDFYIGAHALISNFTLLTRDKGNFRHYFPKLKIISPL